VGRRPDTVRLVRAAAIRRHRHGDGSVAPARGDRRRSDLSLGELLRRLSGLRPGSRAFSSPRRAPPWRPPRAPSFPRDSSRGPAALRVVRRHRACGPLDRRAPAIRRAAEEISIATSVSSTTPRSRGRGRAGRRRRRRDDRAPGSARRISDRVARRRAPGSPRVLLASGHGGVLDRASVVLEGEFLPGPRRGGRREGPRGRSSGTRCEPRRARLAAARHAPRRAPVRPRGGSGAGGRGRARPRSHRRRARGPRGTRGGPAAPRRRVRRARRARR
jgi:hypothetical protein